MHEAELEGDDDLLALLAQYREHVNAVMVQRERLRKELCEANWAEAEALALVLAQDGQIERLRADNETMCNTLTRVQKRSLELLERARRAEQQRDDVMEELARRLSPAGSGI